MAENTGKQLEINAEGTPLGKIFCVAEGKEVRN
jgi:hypothetical protein